MASPRGAVALRDERLPTIPEASATSATDPTSAARTTADANARAKPSISKRKGAFIRVL